eukprot:TRINITY_DN6727_c0_g1_i1.p1 TRINITY_DN6727_c0_g1~~TRINITY_DN6727_c0_g1_i1.p1  ORF type:complete len:388 (-),score=25.06 TRINITY_DN6727_c0_g1_i1:91-1254(-)
MPVSRSSVPILFLFVLVDVLGFSLILPLFPYLTKEYGMTPTQIGFLQTSNALAQLFAVPVIGSLSDRHGRKPLLILCVTGTLASFLILAFAKTIPVVFFSRILDGLLGGNISLAQAYITDITSEKDRAFGIGMLGAAFGIAFVCGPAIGGTLALWDYRYPSYLAAMLCVVNLIGILFFLDESLPPNKRQKNSSSYDHFTDLKKCFQNPALAKLLVFRLLSGTAFTLWETSFGFYNKGRLALDARSSGYLLTLFGIVYSLVQARMRTLTHRFDEESLLRYFFVALGPCYFLSGLTQTLIQHVLILIPLGAVSGGLYTLLISRVSKVVGIQVGSTLGVSAAIGSFTRIVAPALGGLLVDRTNLSMPFFVCSAISVCLAFWSFFVKSKAS